MNPTYVYTKPKKGQKKEIVISMMVNTYTKYQVDEANKLLELMNRPHLKQIGEHYKDTIGTLYLN